MPLNKLDNFIKNVEGRILYVNPNDLDSTDSIDNQGNSLGRPFKTIQRALLESARFSYLKGSNNDIVEKTTILLFPGEHIVDNRPGFAIYDDNGTPRAVPPSGGLGTNARATLSLSATSNFDLTENDNILYKFNSIYGGVVVPRGTSIIGLDLRKTKIRPKYVPNPTDPSVDGSAIFRITGACYFWQFSIFDGNELGFVYTDPSDFSANNQSSPLFSHHKLTCFEYADGVNKFFDYGLTDLDMYYSKLSNAFNEQSGRSIDEKFPERELGFYKQRPEWEIVGAFATDPIEVSSIISGNGVTASNVVTVTTAIPHGLTTDTPIKITGVSVNDYNVTTKVQNVLSSTQFTFLLPAFRNTLPASPSAASAFVVVETDTVSGASPYIFNISLRSVWGMNGMLSDGAKASGFRSMVVAQFTAVSLQKDDRAFVKYNPVTRVYEGVNPLTKVVGAELSLGSAQTDPNKVYHLDPRAIYRRGWETSHIKVTNDAFIQVVSVFAIGFNKHFDVESGGDASITNSNSNFGQISLNSSGFKKEAFTKDNNCFITSIIPPRELDNTEEQIQWISLDVGLTTSVGISKHLYLFGFTAESDTPPILIQGYKIGARKQDKLYLSIGGTQYKSDILMCDNVIGVGTTAVGTTSAVKEYSVTSGPTNNIFTISTIGSHNLQTGEKIIINSETGDLPENIVPHQVYYAIRHSATQIKLASSFTDASLGQEIVVYGGSQLKVLSRVSDKESGDIGSPVQFDRVRKNWFIHVNTNNEIYNALSTLGVSGIGADTTDLTFVNRVPDSRGLDEKLYKVRVVIPKEFSNAKNPEGGFVIQESSSTGFRNNFDFVRTSIGSTDYGYSKNPRFIARCTRVSSTVTVLCEQPHRLKVGDSVNIRNVTDSSNPNGDFNKGYNGSYTVASIVDDMSFTYTNLNNPSLFTNNVNLRTTDLPRFERNDLQSNFYVYRNEVIKPYIQGSQDGVYHLYVLNAEHTVTTEFTNIKYSQNVLNLYPQLDRDNIEYNPPAAQTFAKRSPIGEVITSDLKKSLTRECIDTLVKDFRFGQDISSVTTTPSTATLTFPRRHGFSGVISGTIVPGGGYTDGTYHNVRLFSNIGLTVWNGATAKVVISGGEVTSVEIISKGSGYSAGTLYFDTSVIGSGTGASYSVATAGISTNIGDVVQVTGIGTATDKHYRIVSVPSSTTVSIARTAGDPLVVVGQYALNVGPSVRITESSYGASTGISTFTTSGPHGLLSGNKITIVNSTNNNLGEYLVKERVNLTSFSVVTNKALSATNGFVLKHGLDSSNAISDAREENFGIRNTPFYEGESLTVASFTTEDRIGVSSPVSGIGTTRRFPLGSYIQIDNEIMRITSSTLGGTNNDEITVIRGALGTLKENHDDGSLIRKINPLAIEFRRPSIIRASGHTFEYLGYGPGNYSTGLPQIQVTTLSDQEEYLAQAQKRSAGSVLYTGMNSRGDFYIGNNRVNSTTGEQEVFDVPVPTVTGANPAKLSAVFDEVTIKGRLLVEGGDSGNILSQFDGPVTFNEQTRYKEIANFNNEVRITNEKSSTSSSNGALTVRGGVGIQQNLNIGENLSVIGALTVAGISTFNNNVSIRGLNKTFTIQNESSQNRFIVNSTTGNTTISGTLGVTGATTLSSTLGVTGATTLSSTLGVTGATTLSGATTLNNTLTTLNNVSILPLNNLDANSTDTIRNSSQLLWGSKYWNGVSSVNTDWNSLVVPTNTVGASEWRLRIGTTNIVRVANDSNVIATNFTGALDGNAASATVLQTTRTLWGQNFNGSANVTGNLTSVGNITGSGAITITSGGTTNNVTVNTAGTGSIILDTGTAGGTVQLRAGTNGTRIYNAANTFYTEINAEALSAIRTLTFANANTTLVGGTMVPTTIDINTEDGLSGGGNLSESRTLTVDSSVARRNVDQTFTETQTFSSTISGSINGNAASATILETTRTLWGQNFNGSQNVTGNLTSVGNITGSGAITITSGGTTNNVTVNTAGTGSIILDTGTAGGTVQLRAGTNGTRIYNAANTFYTEINAEALSAIRTLTFANANTTLVGGTMVPTTGIGATGTWGISITGNAATATTATNCSREIIEGDGMNFTGGELNDDRTITLGTPSSITSTSTNAVTTSSHTHLLATGAVTDTKIASNAVTTNKILNNAVTLDKLQTISNNRVLGRTDAESAGTVEEVTVRTSVRASGTATDSPLVTEKAVRDAVNGVNITSANFAGQSGSAPVYGIRAWGIMINGSTSSPTITGGNLNSTVNRSRSGTYNITFTTSMPTTNYAVIATIGSNQDHVTQIINKSTGGFTAETYDAGGGNNERQNTNIIMFMVIC